MNRKRDENNHIVGVIIGGSRLFYAVDGPSGGYPYFVSDMDSAERMSLTDAKKVIANIQRPNTAEGHLNDVLSQAVYTVLRTVTDNPIVVEAEIYKISLFMVDSVEFIARSTVNEVLASRNELIERARAKLTDEERKALGI